MEEMDASEALSRLGFDDLERATARVEADREARRLLRLQEAAALELQGFNAPLSGSELLARMADKTEAVDLGLDDDSAHADVLPKEPAKRRFPPPPSSAPPRT